MQQFSTRRRDQPAASSLLEGVSTGTNGFIFRLPDEILHFIIDLCRPDSFESIMLASRRFYMAGEKLIHSHNICKSLIASVPILEDEYTSIYYVKDPLLLLRKLTTLPLMQKLDGLRYVKNLIYHITPPWQEYNNRKSEGQKLYIQMENKHKKLCKAISEMAKQFLRSHGEDCDGNTPEVLDGLNAMARMKPSEAQFTDGFHWTVPNSPHPESCGLVLLPFYIGVEVLVLSHSWDWGYQPSFLLPDLIRHDRDRTYFQQLKVLFLKRHWNLGFHQIEPFLRLPKLESIVFECFNANYALPAIKEESTLSDQPSQMKRLVFCSGFYNSQQFRNILKQAPALRTLVWHDGTTPPFGWYPANQRPQDLSSTTESAKDTDFTIDIDMEPLTADLEWLQSRPIFDESRIFKPTQLISDILLTHKSKLERLSIMRTNYLTRDFYVKVYQIPHLRDFERMTHLELDLHVLRPSRAPWISGPLYPPLAKIMPRTLQVLLLAYPWRNVGDFLKSLESFIHAKTSDMPDLRLIHVRGWNVEVDMKGIQKLQVEFEKVNVRFEFSGYIFENWCPQPLMYSEDEEDEKDLFKSSSKRFVSLILS
jgi:hypothetical protein